MMFAGPCHSVHVAVRAAMCSWFSPFHFARVVWNIELEMVLSQPAAWLELQGCETNRDVEIHEKVF